MYISAGFIDRHVHSGGGEDFINGTQQAVETILEVHDVTHIYNGNSWISSPYYYCQIGVCEAALLIDQVYVEVIADCCHLPWQILKLI